MRGKAHHRLSYIPAHGKSSRFSSPGLPSVHRDHPLLRPLCFTLPLGEWSGTFASIIVGSSPNEVRRTCEMSSKWPTTRCLAGRPPKKSFKSAPCKGQLGARRPRSASHTAPRVPGRMGVQGEPTARRYDSLWQPGLQIPERGWACGGPGPVQRLELLASQEQARPVGSPSHLPFVVLA